MELRGVARCRSLFLSNGNGGLGGHRMCGAEETNGLISVSGGRASRPDQRPSSCPGEERPDGLTRIELLATIQLAPRTSKDQIGRYQQAGS